MQKKREKKSFFEKTKFLNIDQSALLAEILQRDHQSTDIQTPDRQTSAFLLIKFIEL